jgi:hypothetical protein
VKISVSSAELQKVPDVIQRLIPTMDVSALRALLVGVSFPQPGTITTTVKLSATDTLTIELDTSP